MALLVSAGLCITPLPCRTTVWHEMSVTIYITRNRTVIKPWAGRKEFDSRLRQNTSTPRRGRLWCLPHSSSRSRGLCVTPKSGRGVKLTTHLQLGPRSLIKKRQTNLHLHIQGRVFSDFKILCNQFDYNDAKPKNITYNYIAIAVDPP